MEYSKWTIWISRYKLNALQIIERHYKEELLKWHARTKVPIVCEFKSENESMLVRMVFCSVAVEYFFVQQRSEVKKSNRSKTLEV